MAAGPTALLALACVAVAGSAAAAPVHVIPAGQESLVEEMLGGGDTLPGACRLEGAEIEQQRIVARYGCSTGAVTVVLADPEGGSASAGRTATFAWSATGTLPSGLLAALMDRVRGREEGFLWHGVEVPSAAGPAPVPSPAGRVPWILLAALLLAAVGTAGARPSARDAGVAVALWGFALGLHAVLGPWGPFHVNGQGPVWLVAAIGDAGSLANYGPGYAEVLAPFARLWPGAPDDAVFLANAAFCAAIPALAWAVARLLQLDVRVSFAAAALLAIDPVALRVGATESYVPMIAALSLAAAGLVLAAARSASDGRGWVAAALGTAAGLLGAQVARVHPLAWGAVALVPTLALAVPGRVPWRKRLVLAAGAVVLVGVVVAAVSGGVVAASIERMRGSALMRPDPPGLDVPFAVGALVAACAVLVWRRGTRWLVLAAIPWVLWPAVTAQYFHQSGIVHQAYLRIFTTLPWLALAAQVPRRWAVVAAGVAAFAVAVVGGAVVPARTTDHHEYRWLRPRLAALPDGCYVAHLSKAGMRALYLPVYPPHHALSLDAGATIAPALLAGGRCVAYVHGSICTSVAGRPACEAIERQLALDVVARTTLPAAPSSFLEPYDRDAVECWVARVRDVVPPHR